MTQIIHWAVKMVPDIAEMAMNKFAVCIEFCMQPGQTLRQVALWSASWSLSLMCSLCVKYSTISCWGRCNFIYVPVEWDYLKVRFEWCHKINHDLSFLSVSFIMTLLSVLCNYFPRYYEIHYPVAWIHPNLFSLLFILTLNTLSFVSCSQTFILRSFFLHSNNRHIFCFYRHIYHSGLIIKNLHAHYNSLHHLGGIQNMFPRALLLSSDFFPPFKYASRSFGGCFSPNLASDNHNAVGARKGPTVSMHHRCQNKWKTPNHTHTGARGRAR